jgi:ATP-binding cassette, subfamily B (MDR/TAP), member 1
MKLSSSTLGPPLTLEPQHSGHAMLSIQQSRISSSQTDMPSSGIADSKSFLALFAFTRRDDVCALLCALIFAACSALPLPASAILVGKFGDIMTKFGAGFIDSGELWRQNLPMVHGFVGIGIAILVFDAAMFGAWTLFAELQARHAREDVFKCLLHKEVVWFEAREAGIAAHITRCSTYGLDTQLADHELMKV